MAPRAIDPSVVELMYTRILVPLEHSEYDDAIVAHATYIFLSEDRGRRIVLPRLRALDAAVPIPRAQQADIGPARDEVLDGRVLDEEIADRVARGVGGEHRAEPEVTGVDAQKRVVRLEQHDVPYDFLILPTGVQYNYFGHDEWSRIAPGLVSPSDADRIRARLRQGHLVGGAVAGQGRAGARPTRTRLVPPEAGVTEQELT